MLVGEIDKIHQILPPLPNLPAVQHVGDGANRRPPQQHNREQRDALDLHESEEGDTSVTTEPEAEQEGGLDLAI